MRYETDSRKVKQGQIFVAIKGHTVDGHDYIDQAIQNGAKKIIAQKDVTASVAVEVVGSTEEYLKAKLVEEYSQKINELTIIGLTGTNGKTTSCYLMYQMLQKLGINVAYLGTIGYYHNDKFIELENTTPDILTLYNLLLNAIDNGAKYLVMEVSSHALSYERIAGLKFSAAGFTNLTEDHLDYHKTMEAYLNEKLKIVNYLKKDATLLLNSDDKASTNFMNKYPNYKTFGLNGDYKILDFNILPDHTDLKFSFANNEYNVTTNLTSKFNVYNYLTCISILNSLGFSLDDLVSITSSIYPPKGRCETYKVGKGYAVVDYAHTPDAVYKVIEAYNELKQNRVITIVGCGGDRDPIKRPIMGDIATKLSDYVILTSDNPRTEDPQKIMDDILKGVKTNNYEVILDRKEAIKKALDDLEENDILLVLGKGHEDYQIIGHTKIHLDDKEEILNWKKENEK